MSPNTSRQKFLEPKIACPLSSRFLNFLIQCSTRLQKIHLLKILVLPTKTCLTLKDIGKSDFPCYAKSLNAIYSNL